MRKLTSIAAALVMMCSVALAQGKPPRPSGPGAANYTFPDGKKIDIKYSRPKIADPKTGEKRQIMGKLVPYGEPWRTGANEATSFVTDTDLDINGTKVPAGSYTLYTLPSATTWKLIISKKTGQWGIPYPGESEDFARIDMKSAKPKATVDPFTISLDKESGGKTARLLLAWENTGEYVDIKEAK